VTTIIATVPRAVDRVDAAVEAPIPFDADIFHIAALIAIPPGGWAAASARTHQLRQGQPVKNGTHVSRIRNNQRCLQL
jgi:hypothetical protein